MPCQKDHYLDSLKNRLDQIKQISQIRRQITRIWEDILIAVIISIALQICVCLCVYVCVNFICLFYFILIFLSVLGLRCCTRAFSSCGEQGLLFVALRGLLIVVASLVAEHGLQAQGLQQLQHVGSRGSLTGSREQAWQLWHTGFVALRHVGSSRTRDRTHVSCIGRWILNRCTTGEVPYMLIL